MNPVRLLVIAEDPLARAGLATLLSNERECIVIGQVAPDADVKSAIQVYLPDVIVFDLGVNPIPSLEHLAEWRDAQVVLALLPDEAAASAAWSSGARGLLLRNCLAEQIVAAAQALAQGLDVISPNLASALISARTFSTSPPIKDLTPREREVLQLLAEGHSNKEIARRLDISEHTVKFHVNAILGKLNVQSRTEAVVQATRLGLVLL